MNCLEFRRLTLINPEDTNPARLAHEQECLRCTDFARQLLRQDDLIREASRIDAPEGFAARIILNQSLQAQSRRPTRWYWLGLAASFLLAVALIPNLIDDASYAFEEGLVAHVSAHNVLSADYHGHVTEMQDVKQVLATANTAMPNEVQNVIYASTCIVDGEVMAHLLVENDDQQYVVFIIPERSIVERPFQHADWSVQTAMLDDRGIAVMSRSGNDVSAAAAALSRQFDTPLSSGQTI
ncbi:MAG: DUF3379 family protein [Gammaproteobacteria bacterium]|nr:DUF3379 family protein [Gammaproteobacteria bacterium]MBT7369029.1 DUF3379 family protein [Gammaproteobacteria bacterium]